MYGLIPSEYGYPPSCAKCDQIETMEHLIHQCEHYSELIWSEFSTVLTQAITQIRGQFTARIDLTPLEIIFNKLPPSIENNISDKGTLSAFTHLIQETKREIIYRRMTPNLTPEITPLIRIQAHIISVIKKVHSLLTYQGHRQQSLTIQFLETFQQIIESRIV